MRDIFEKDLSIHIPSVAEPLISAEMLTEVSESDRKTFRVSSKVHQSWQKYRDLLTVNQYLCLVTMVYEAYSEFVDSYQNGEIDEIEFTRAIAGERNQR